MSRFVDVYVTPPAVFVAVLIGGGYGTGREVVEFFSRHGALGGLIGIVLACVLFALIFGATFEFARRTGGFDYVSFFRGLIGPWWWTFEALYLALLLLVLSVLSSAAGAMAAAEFGVDEATGVLAALVGVALLILFGRIILERILTAWTFTMYGVFAVYFYFAFGALDFTALALDSPAGYSGSAVGGALYVLYNGAIAPVLLFAARGLQSREDSWRAGTTTALVLMIPAAMFHLTFSLSDPTVLTEAVPVYWMIDHYMPAEFRLIFVLVLLGTLLQTGAGLVHGVIERLEQAFLPEVDDGLGVLPRLAIAMSALTASWVLAQFGVIALIGRGYSALAVGFALVYALPLLLRGTGLMKAPRSRRY